MEWVVYGNCCRWIKSYAKIRIINVGVHDGFLLISLNYMYLGINKSLDWEVQLVV